MFADASLPILTYHSLDCSGSVVSVRPERFDEQMSTVEALGHRAVCLREAVSHRRETGQWPPRAVVLTFDDGYANLHRHALPALARRGFAATVFLATDHVGGHNDWEAPPPGLGLQPMLDWSQVAELAEEGWEVGAHTRTHPDLTALTGDEAESEMRGSRKEIEERLQQPVESFAYPFGYASELVTAIAAREFRASCTTELRCATSEPLHSLPRVDAYYLQPPGRMRKLLDGRLGRYLMIRRWGRRARSVLSRS